MERFDCQRDGVVCSVASINNTILAAGSRQALNSIQPGYNFPRYLLILVKTKYRAWECMFLLESKTPPKTPLLLSGSGAGFGVT